MECDWNVDLSRSALGGPNHEGKLKRLERASSGNGFRYSEHKMPMASIIANLETVVNRSLRKTSFMRFVVDPCLFTTGNHAKATRYPY